MLTLVGKLVGKIGDINDAMGLDADLLDQGASPKSFRWSAMGTSGPWLRAGPAA